MLGKEKINDLFGYHEPVICKDPDDEEGNAVVTKHLEARRKFRDLATYLDELLPDNHKFPAAMKDVIMDKLSSVSTDVHRAIAAFSPARLTAVEMIPLEIALDEGLLEDWANNGENQEPVSFSATTQIALGDGLMEEEQPLKPEEWVTSREHREWISSESLERTHIIPAVEEKE